ncbi:MAG TPA: transglutaminase domain-containing protein [Candidatus Limnocylindria bacterium]
MPEWLRRLTKPREGWLALALLFVMLLSLSWSVQRAGWLEQADFLVPVAFYAIALGTLLGLTAWSVVAVLPLAAVAGVGIGLWAVGGEYFPDLDQLGRLLALRGDAIEWTRLVVDVGYAPQLTPYAIGMALLTFATGFIAAYTIYRHHRVVDAILLVAAPMIVNQSATLAPVFGYLVLFMLAALLLWLRAALVSRQESWQRRRVNENVEVPAAIMRSGVVFIGGSIALAWILTLVAVAAPLTAVWNSADTVWTGLRNQFEGVFGGINNPESRISGSSFGPSFRISGHWFSSDEPVLTLAATKPYYLATTVYDRYTGHGFVQTDGVERLVAAGDAVFPGETPERPTQSDAFTAETVTIEMQKTTGRNLFTPGYPTRVLAPVYVNEMAGQPLLGGLSAASAIPAGSGYLITAAISQATKAQLAAAGTEYPELIRRYYLGTDGVTDRTRQLALDVVQEAGASNPFEQAEALAAFLRTDPRFDYRTDAPIPERVDQDFVDFFLFESRVGYCQFYATAMAVMARSLGLPSRVVGGFAPGERVGPTEDGQGSIYQVREANAHAWVEIYFPGYGWQPFESTKTKRAVTRVTGQPRPSTGPGASPTTPPLIEGVDGIVNSLPSFQPVPGGLRPGETTPPPDPRGGNTVLIVGILLVVLLVAAWRWRRTRAGLRFLAPGERQWRRLALAADRAGVAQRPSETIYEYASWLEEQIPSRRREIRTIADGKVWQSYSGRGVTSEIIARIEAAWQRLQMPLVGLTLKRWLRRLVPGRR